MQRIVNHVVFATASAALVWGCGSPELCNPGDGNTDCGLESSIVLLATAVPAVTPAPVTPCSELSSCIIFATAATWDGRFGGLPGISGADARCNSDPNKPANSGNYKAMIVDGSSRRASVTASVGDGQIDWVLYANKLYRRSDGTNITTSSSARLLTFPLTNAISPDIPGKVVWTGMVNDWTTSASICVSWTSISIAQYGFTATEYDVTNTAIQSGNFSCDNSQALYCVQQ